MADRVGAGMASAADSLREHAPDKGMLHSAASKVADTLESGALEDELGLAVGPIGLEPVGA